MSVGRFEMKCAVVVLSAALFASAFNDVRAQANSRYYCTTDCGDGSSGYQQVYSTGQQGYQQSGELPNGNYQYSGEVTPSYQYQQQYAPISNSIDGYQQSYQPQYYPETPATPGTPIQYGAPLAPYPPQLNAHQQALYGAQRQYYGPQQPFYGQQYGPLPGYTDLFGPTAAPGGTLVSPATLVKPTIPTRPPTTPQPNNIFSLLLSLSQSSSGVSKPATTKRPVATIRTTGQPAPKAQIFSFANAPPPPYQGQPFFIPQNRPFNPFSLQ